MVSLGGMVQWSLVGGCVLMEECKVVVLFGVMEASMAGLARIMWIFTLKMGRWYNGGGVF
jgi:hypothetical protein